MKGQLTKIIKDFCELKGYHYRSGKKAFLLLSKDEQKRFLRSMKIQIRHERDRKMILGSLPKDAVISKKPSTLPPILVRGEAEI